MWRAAVGSRELPQLGDDSPTPAPLMLVTKKRVRAKLVATMQTSPPFSHADVAFPVQGGSQKPAYALLFPASSPGTAGTLKERLLTPFHGHSQGVKVDARDHSGATARMLAKQYGHMKIVALMDTHSPSLPKSLYRSPGTHTCQPCPAGVSGCLQLQVTWQRKMSPSSPAPTFSSEIWLCLPQLLPCQG